MPAEMSDNDVIAPYLTSEQPVAALTTQPELRAPSPSTNESQGEAAIPLRFRCSLCSGGRCMSHMSNAPAGPGG
jgi:hypothetical protein